MLTRARLRVAQKVIGTIGILIALIAVGTMFMPFRILDVQCGSAVTGSKVEVGAPQGSLVQDNEVPLCHKKGSSRLITAGVVIVLGGALGYGGWLLPLEPPWYRAEDDDDESHTDRTAPRPLPARKSLASSAVGSPDPGPGGPVRTKPRVVVGEHVRDQRPPGDDLVEEDPGVPSAEPPPRRVSRSPARGVRPSTATPAGRSDRSGPPTRSPSGGRSGTGPVSVPRPGRPPAVPPVRRPGPGR
ncbi:MAG: hypothetical protein DLM54_11365 [Acidimicrobiales bacterium]|nr:MAG: hypothetical protein DLM54_11365 [Acidimicrobiales bacterium]